MSDTHYGHWNICKHCDRPFSDVHHMNSILTNNHNSIVRPNDNVIHLGDFCFRGNSADSYITRLNGNIWFVLGTHDKDLKKFFGDSIMKQFNGKTYRILPAESMISIDGQKIVLSHYAMLTWASKHHGNWMLHGHSHYNLKATQKDGTALGKILDVGVDGNDFKPYSFDEIFKIMENKPTFPVNDVLNDHHGNINNITIST